MKLLIYTSIKVNGPLEDLMDKYEDVPLACLGGRLLDWSSKLLDAVHTMSYVVFPCIVLLLL